MRKKIYTLEKQRGDFDEIPTKELQDSVGWIEPTDDGKWDINLLSDGEGYTAERQTDANIIGSLEEIKALLIKLLEKD